VALDLVFGEPLTHATLEDADRVDRGFE